MIGKPNSESLNALLLIQNNGVNAIQESLAACFDNIGVHRPADIRLALKIKLDIHPANRFLPREMLLIL